MIPLSSSGKLLDALLGSNRQTRFSVRPRITTRSWTHWTRDRLHHAMQ
jgi:hypothetical protein